MQQINITHTTMGVRIEVPIRPVEIAIKTWAERNLHAPKMGKERGKITVEQGDGYYAHMEGARSFIFHKAHLEEILSIIKNAIVEYRLDAEVKHHKVERSEPYRCTFENFGTPMIVDDPESRFYYQNEVVEKALDPDRMQTIFAIDTGRGKCLVHGTKVRIPGGWKNIEELRVGDYVIGRDGKPTKVLAVYANGVVDMYNVTFADGRSIVACGDHQWSSFQANKPTHKRWKVRTTKEMMWVLSQSQPRMYIPLPEPEETTEKDFPVNPYLLGALIGNGTMTGKSVFFSSRDVETVDLIGRHLPPNSYIRHSAAYDYYVGSSDNVATLRSQLSDLGLWGCRSWEKFIPEQYLEGSIEQRWELLRGLMDTDGTVNKDGGQPSYCTTSKMLALQVQQLVRSMGGIASISEKTPTYSYNGEKREGRLAYNVFIRCKKPSLLFNLERKKVLCRDNGQYNDSLKLRVVSIEPMGRDLGTCITVDNEDSLYVAEQYIVTHNTKSLMKVMVKKQVRTSLIMRPTYVDKWISDICDDPTGLRIDRDKVLVCRGVQGIIEAYEMGLSGELDRRDIRAIIFPTVSLQLFLKEYINTGHSMGIDIERFYDVLGVGLIGMDEVHEHFYLVYLAGIILNPCAAVEMSATLEPGAAKTFIISRYLERFPMDLRLSVERIKVVDIRAFYYTLDDKKMAWWATKMSPYNHKLFEGKLIREGFHVSYCEMWWNLIEKVFLSNYQPGQKIIILFSTVDMCEFFTQFLHQKLAGTEFNELMVAKYNGGDSYDDFIMAEFGVSTPNKAGTAIDKPGMVHMIVTVPVDDQQLNLQIAGRPRPVREVFGWDMNPIVWFGHCMNIAKHGTYLNSRMRSLRDTVLSFKVATSPYVVRKTYDNAPSSSRPNSPLRRIDVGRLSRKGAKGLSRRRRRR